MELSPAYSVQAETTAIFSVRFSPDDAFLAAASDRGPISIYNNSTGREAYRLNRNGTHPVKQVCWRPEQEDASLRTRGVLVGASTDGRLRQWHVTSTQCLHEFGEPDETGQLFCVDYSADGTRLVAGGLQDLWVFDEETKQQTARLSGGETTAGHSNRVFAVRFHKSPDEPSTVISGGWDSTVQFWDLRVGCAVRSINGPHLCGDSLDVSADGSLLMTGSCRHERQLELWDTKSGRCCRTIAWRGPGFEAPPCHLYASRFSSDPGSSLIAAGGTFANGGGGEVKIFDRSGTSRAGDDYACVGTLADFTCLCVDFSRGPKTTLAMGGVHVMHVEPPA